MDTRHQIHPDAAPEFAWRGCTHASLSWAGLPRFQDGDPFANAVKTHQENALRERVDSKERRGFFAGLLCLGLEHDWVSTAEVARALTRAWHTVEIAERVLARWGTHLNQLVCDATGLHETTDTGILVLSGSCEAREEAMQICLASYPTDVWHLEHSGVHWWQSVKRMPPHIQEAVWKTVLDLNALSLAYLTLDDLTESPMMWEQIGFYEEEVLSARPEDREKVVAQALDESLFSFGVEDANEWLDMMAEFQGVRERWHAMLQRITDSELVVPQDTDPWSQWCRVAHGHITRLKAAEPEHSLEATTDEASFEEQPLCCTSVVVPELSPMIEQLRLDSLDQMIQAGEWFGARWVLNPRTRHWVAWQLECLATIEGLLLRADNLERSTTCPES